MQRVCKVEHRHHYRLYIEFDDGVAGFKFDCCSNGTVHSLLSGNPEVFRQVGVDEFGVVCWPNGADLAPDALHSALAS